MAPNNHFAAPPQLYNYQRSQNQIAIRGQIHMAQEVNRRLQNIVIVDTFYARQTFHTINNLINLLNTCLH